MNPPPIYRHTLTGACRPRRGWFGRVVMQVEVRVESLSPWPRTPPMPPIADERVGAYAERLAEQKKPWVRPVTGTWYEWRDARLSDFVLTQDRDSSCLRFQSTP